MNDKLLSVLRPALLLAVAVAVAAVGRGVEATVDVTSELVTLVLPMLLDFQLVLLPVDVGKAPSIGSQVARFCLAHGIADGRCHVINDALRQAADLDGAVPCRRIATDGLPAFARVKNILFTPRKASTKSAFRTVTFEWSKIETAQIVDSVCNIVAPPGGDDGVAADECATVLTPTLDQSFEWLRTLAPCAEATETRNVVISDVVLPAYRKPNSPEVAQRVAAVERLIASLSMSQDIGSSQIVDPISGVSVTSLDRSDERLEAPGTNSHDVDNHVHNSSTEPPIRIARINETAIARSIESEADNSSSTLESDPYAELGRGLSQELVVDEDAELQVESSELFAPEAPVSNQPVADVEVVGGDDGLTKTESDGMMSEQGSTQSSMEGDSDSPLKNADIAIDTSDEEMPLSSEMAEDVVNADFAAPSNEEHIEHEAIDQLESSDVEHSQGEVAQILPMDETVVDAKSADDSDLTAQSSADAEPIPAEEEHASLWDTVSTALLLVLCSLVVFLCVDAGSIALDRAIGTPFKADAQAPDQKAGGDSSHALGSNTVSPLSTTPVSPGVVPEMNPQNRSASPLLSTSRHDDGHRLALGKLSNLHIRTVLGGPRATSPFSPLNVVRTPLLGSPMSTSSSRSLFSPRNKPVSFSAAAMTLMASRHASAVLLKQQTRDRQRREANLPTRERSPSSPPLTQVDRLLRDPAMLARLIDTQIADHHRLQLAAKRIQRQWRAHRRSTEIESVESIHLDKDVDKISAVARPVSPAIQFAPSPIARQRTAAITASTTTPGSLVRRNSTSTA
ncbi:hypothetical protein PINS_up009995 [Pythium insidiosum]|nr:hypothetical protein PINS_up009995 [Pythium insidiosum]